MKTFILPALAILFIVVQSPAQTQCDYERKTQILHGNEVWAKTGNTGINFSDPNFDGYVVPFGQPDLFFDELGTFNSLWLGGKDNGGNLKIAGGDYGVFSGQTDFWPGPLGEYGTTENGTCDNWNKFWSVRRHEVEAHLADFQANGFVLNWQPSIFGWPGNGNIYFNFINGFDLPDTPQGLAPFYDQNSDGVYDPLNGDYPLPENVDRIPDQTIWCVFNDEGGGSIHGITNGLAIRAEIHQTLWVFSCEDNPVLNRTVFGSFKVINRAAEFINDFYMGFFIDHDIGCFVDDGFGGSAALNTAFSYNLDNEDGDNVNCSDISPAGENPPVLSSTVLNRELAYLMPSVPIGGCPGMPVPDIDYYLLLTGQTSYGQSLTYGEFGCNPDNPPTNIIFPDDPNDPTGWSMLTLDSIELFDRRFVMSVKLNDLGPGEFDVVDMAYSYHSEPGLNNLENVTLMYEEVAQIHELYGNQFQDNCAQSVCTDDCVWPGDADRDDIANHRDLLAIAVASDETGAVRENSLTWAPHEGTPWNGNFLDGHNFKHADCDGSGLVEMSDFEITKTNYNLETPDFFNAADVYQEGPELFLTRGGADPSFDDLSPGEFVAAKVNIADVPDLFGLAFQMEYDRRYFEGFSFTGGPSFGSTSYTFRGGFVQDGEMNISDHALVRLHKDSTIGAGRLFNILIDVQSDFDEPLPSNQTEIRFKNIKAIRSDGSIIDIGATTMTATFVDVPTAVREVGESNPLVVHPNPTAGTINMDLGGEIMEEITLVDVFGKKVFYDKIMAAQYEKEITGLPNGLYWAMVKGKGKVFVRKLIINR